MISRRNFLAATGGAAASLFAPIPGFASELGKVKITGLKTASVHIKYPAHLVRVETDSGLYGIGEAFNRDGVIDHIRALEGAVVGQDPLQWDVLYNRMIEAKLGHGSWTGTVSSAISGIETAILDLAGKILDVPVYTLLGGKYRDKVLIYHDTGSPQTADPAPWVDEARKTVEYGFRATKFDLDWESRGRQLAGQPYQYRQEIWNRGITSVEMKQWIKMLEAIRAELGDDFPFGIDLHFNYNYADALRFSNMTRDLNLWFIEDPLPPQNVDAMARFTQECEPPTCTGENLYTLHTFREFIEKQAADMIQPDPQKSGGLVETKRIAEMADLYYITFACHNMCTPVGTVANAHLCAAVRNFVALESDSVELEHWDDLIVREAPFYQDGYYVLNDKPGLGIELNDEVARRHLVEDSSYFE